MTVGTRSQKKDELVVKFESPQDKERVKEDADTVHQDLTTWVCRTYTTRESNRDLDAMDMFCNYCGFASRFEEDHIEHLFHAHPYRFEGFACHLCDFVSANPDSQSGHTCRRLRSHSGKGQLSPSASGATSGTQEASPGKQSVRGQKRGVRAKEIVRCELCGKMGTSRGHMRLHVYRQHADVMVCPVCGAQPGNDRLFFNHFRDLHPDQRHLFHTVKVSCHLSTHTSTTARGRNTGGAKNSLKKPLRSPQKTSSAKSRAGAPSASQSASVQKTFKGSWKLCQVCNHGGRSWSRMRAHMYTDHKEIMKCPECGVCPENDMDFYEHLVREHNKGDVYDECRSRNWIIDEMTTGARPVVSTAHTQRTKKRKATGSATLETRAKTPRESWERPRGVDGKFLSTATDRRSSTAPQTRSSHTGETEVAPSASTRPRKVRPSHTDGPEAACTSSREADPAADVIVEEMEYRCPYCTFVTKDRRRCYRHLCCHCHYPRFQCQVCSFSAYSGASVSRHRHQEHGEQGRWTKTKNATLEARVLRLLQQAHVPVRRRPPVREMARPKAAAKQQERSQTMASYLKNKKRTKPPAKQQERSETQGSYFKNKKRTKPPAKQQERSETQGSYFKHKKRTKPPAKRETSSVGSEGSASYSDWDGKLVCPYCRGERMTKLAVRDEIRRHIHYQPFRCMHCELSSSSRLFIKKHIHQRHPGEEVCVLRDRDEEKEAKLKRLYRKAVALSRASSRHETPAEDTTRRQGRQAGPSKRAQHGKSHKHFCRVCPATGPDGKAVPLHYTEDHIPDSPATLPLVSGVTIHLPSTSTASSTSAASTSAAQAASSSLSSSSSNSRDGKSDP